MVKRKAFITMEDIIGTYTYKYPHPSVTADCVIFGFDCVDELKQKVFRLEFQNGTRKIKR